MTQQKTIWVFTDDRAGNNAQALGVAESTGFPFEIKQIKYSKSVILPNFVRGASTTGIAEETLKQIRPPYPDFVIAAGRRAAPLARFVKKSSENKTKLVQIMFPGLVGLNDFDLVVLPCHDGFTQNRNNVARFIGAPNRVTAEKLEAEKKRWEPKFKNFPPPRVALIVGGKTKNKPFTLAHAEQLARQTKTLMARVGARSLMVTTSRRTGDLQEEKLRELLPDSACFYSYKDTEKENPYFGFLATADYIIVTGDSMSMCSEACATEAPVYVYAPENFCAPKHVRFHKQLFEAGYALPLSDAVENPLPHPPLNIARQIAERIKKL